MISLTLPTKRPPSLLPQHPTQTGKTNYKYLPIDIYNKRQKIIADLYAACPYTVGEVVRPCDDDLFKKEGAFRITGICKDWKDYKGSEPDETKVEWKNDDFVYMVHAIQIKNNKVWSTTTGYFCKMKKNDSK